MYCKVTTLRMMLRVGVRVESGRAAIPDCMMPPRRGECSLAGGLLGVTTWLTKTRLSMRVPCEMSKRLSCLRGRLIARERAVAVCLAAADALLAQECIYQHRIPYCSASVFIIFLRIVIHMFITCSHISMII